MAMFVHKKVNRGYKPFLLNKTIHKNEELINEISNPPMLETINKKEIDKLENNKKPKIDTVMTTAEKISAMNDAMSEVPFKKIKKDKGLIERTESSITILTDDNKELLKD